jgi:hypothetical protein
MEMKLIGIHQIAYDAIFQHPIARNLQWREVKALLTALAEVTEEHSGNVKFTRNGQSITVHPPQKKDFSDLHELMEVRHFLERSNTPSQAVVAVGVHLLVVIDHREARIYRAELHGIVPERVKPFDPSGTHRHLRSVEDDANGQRKPEPKAFYEAVAKTLTGAKEILIFGSGTGASSAMDHLLAELKQHHADLATRVVGCVIVNEQHMTEDQLLAQARAFYAGQPMGKRDVIE